VFATFVQSADSPGQLDDDISRNGYKGDQSCVDRHQRQ